MNYLKKTYKRYNTRRKLMSINPNDVPKFSFLGVEKYCRIYKVYDGDTCTLLFRWKKQNINTSCRIYGIDTPELRTKDPEEKRAGYEAKHFLEKLILGQVLMVKFGKNGKYGRPLIQIFLDDGRSISDVMISSKHAKPYFGGTKDPFKLNLNNRKQK